MRRVFIVSSNLPCRSILKKRGGLPALSTSPGLTQGIGRAEDLQKRLYEAEYKEAKAEDFNDPRTEMDGANEILHEYRRMRAQNQEVCKRIDATPEYQAYDKELSFEVNLMEESFYSRVMYEDMPVTKDNVQTLETAREEICKYYFAKHADILSPIAQRINREVQKEIASGQLVIGEEPDDAFVESLYERRNQQAEDPRIAEVTHKDHLTEVSDEPTQAQLLIDNKYTPEELDRQRERAFVKTTRPRADDDYDSRSRRGR